MTMAHMRANENSVVFAVLYTCALRARGLSLYELASMTVKSSRRSQALLSSVASAAAARYLTSLIVMPLSLRTR